VRVVGRVPGAAEPDGAEPVGAWAGLVRVVGRVPAGAEPDGAEPVEACDGLVRVVTTAPPAEAGAPGAPAPREPLAPVCTDRPRYA
jgi:hypothetical protein